MPQFNYTALNRAGLEVTGNLEAADHRAAVASLRGRALFVLKVDGGAGGADPGAKKQPSLLARLRPVRVHADAASLPLSAAGGLAVVTPAGEARLARGTGDIARERARLERELASVREALRATDARLADTAFTSGVAPL